MKIYYSAFTGGFYRNGDNLPADSVEISAEKFEELMLQQERGMVIVPDAKGLPVAMENVRDPVETATEVKYQNLREASNFIEILQDAVDLGMATDNEIVLLAKWKKYRVLLMRVDTAAPEWPRMPDFQAS